MPSWMPQILMIEFGVLYSVSRASKHHLIPMEPSSLPIRRTFSSFLSE
jgi:hypothetical protein